MAKETETKGVFATLNAVDCNGHTEKKNNLTYLSWVWAVAEVQKRYPDMTYEVKHWDGKPYLFDEHLGYMVETAVTIQGETKEMWLPVMDGANKAQRHVPYTYKTKYGEKTVEAATMFDVNTAIMRCLVKNFAMFGLGLYIYAGSDLPEEVQEQREAEQKAAQQKAYDEYIDKLITAVNNAETADVVGNIWKQYTQYHADTRFKDAVTKRGKELKAAGK